MNPPDRHSVVASAATFASFDAVIDVRSPAEYAEDHVPGALLCPVLDDAERARIGTMYKQESPFQARRLGAALVAQNIARHLEDALAGKPRDWRPLVYCWRGGKRSAAMAHVLREVGWDADGNFTWERFDERYTADLADAFGNLASRVLAMLGRYRGGAVPAAPPTELDAAGDDVVRRYAAAMDGLLLHRGAQIAWELVFEANAYVDRRAPWARAKAGDDAGLDETLGALARCLTRLAVLTAPFIPGAAAQLWAALGLGDGMKAQDVWAQAQRPEITGRNTVKISPLFPKPERPSQTM